MRSFLKPIFKIAKPSFIWLNDYVTISTKTRCINMYLLIMHFLTFSIKPCLECKAN